MKQKSFAILNKGMNRDTSISKTGESSVYENYNIRITATDHDTLLSVTNERGTKAITLSSTIEGELVGWNVLNEYIILFTVSGTTSRIYRVKKKTEPYEVVLLHSGNLGFSTDHPIESICSFETENIQKVYWTDGINPLRMINIVADSDEQSYWDDTFFDANREMAFDVKVDITKDNSGNTRPNGVIQYMMTYYNKHGQETGYAWMSDLIYLSPVGSGGSADETNNNKVTLEISDWDKRFTHYRIYSIFRSSYNGQPVAYLVTDDKTHYDQTTIKVIDDFAHQTSVDPTSLLYLGSKPAVFETMTQKDGTLFLGGIKLNSLGQAYKDFVQLVQDTMIVHSGRHAVIGTDWETNSNYLSFIHSDSEAASGLIPDIDLQDRGGAYSYDNQLDGSSSQITSFKGGEKYRFGLVFRDKNGATTDTIWIGDKVNGKYPAVIGAKIRRVVVQCSLPLTVVTAAKNLGFKTAQLMIAEATYADRAVKAQGILNPTVFNVWNRYTGRIYSMPSWITRPRSSEIANRHFEVIHNSNTKSGEIQCNFWSNDEDPTPYYRIKNYGAGNAEYVDELPGVGDYDYAMLIYEISRGDGGFGKKRYSGTAFAVYMRLNGNSIADANAYVFKGTDLYPNEALTNWSEFSDNGIDFRVFCTSDVGDGYDDTAKTNLYTKLHKALTDNCYDLASYFISDSLFSTWCDNAADTGAYTGHKSWNRQYPSVSDKQNSPWDAANYNPGGSSSSSKWISLGSSSSSSASSQRRAYSPSYYKKNLMFVDENVVTLDSPEITYEALQMDGVENCKLRVVGYAPVTSRISDTFVDASAAALSGGGFVNDKYAGTESHSDLAGITTWPMWREKGLIPIPTGSKGEESNYKLPEKIEERNSSNYIKDGAVVNYWLYMWQKSGVIDDYVDEDVTVFDGDAYSRIRSKAFGNLYYTQKTVFHNNATSAPWQSGTLGDGNLRIFRYTHSQYLNLTIGDESKYYDGIIDDVISMPGSNKYPVLCSDGAFDDETNELVGSPFLYTGAPVPLTYASGAHAVISLPSGLNTQRTKYVQQLLPKLYNTELSYPPTHDATFTGGLLPWIKEQGDVVLYVSWDHDYPTFDIVGNFSLTDERVSLFSTVTWGQQDDDFVRYVWGPAIAANFNNSIYARIPARLGNTVYELLVDISEFYYYRPDPDLGEPTLEIDNAKVLAAYVSGGSDSAVLVDYTWYPDGGQSGGPNHQGWKNLQMSTGTLADVSAGAYPYIDYDVDEEKIYITPITGAGGLRSGEPYLLIGELYYDYTGNDTRYGGITESAIQSCRFIPAGPQAILGSSALSLVGNQGDTYFQRWEDLRTTPLSKSSQNGVFDIVSVMLETHINIDGRYDKLHGTRHITAIEKEEYGNINRAYSQRDNFITNRDLDSDFDLDAYKSSLTWTLQKHESALTDEWMHITLANTLNLDGDKGDVTALRRYQNSILAFQPKGISEILFNSRTQLSTNEGVPVEIGNSGKVDGKNYITNKYGSTNKWAITEGKTGVFFVDNYNKALCRFSGQGVENLSAKLGFSAWFRGKNTLSPWTPSGFGNFVSFYDRINSEVYFLKAKEDQTDTGDFPCLVYNEVLDTFSSFYGYDQVPMIANVEDELVAFKNGLWRMHEGLYCNFFGQPYDFWMTCRVAPEPTMDKVWTNLEYRSDFFQVLDANGNMLVDEEDLLREENYIPDKTFDSFSAWNEYQSTSEYNPAQLSTDRFPDVRKKFRIWRLDIPRAKKDDYNTNGLSRMRNPWIQFRLMKQNTGAKAGNVSRQLMQLHDIIVKYFE